MPYIYVPSSLLGQNARYAGSSAVPPSVGFGGMQAGTDPRKRGRRRSQQEIEAASRKAYQDRQEYIAKLREQNAAREAERKDEMNRRISDRLNRQAERSRLEYVTKFPERAAAEERARQENEAASARARRTPTRLSPAEQQARMEAIRADRREKAISEQFKRASEGFTPTAPAPAPVSETYGPPAPAAAPEPAKSTVDLYHNVDRTTAPFEWGYESNPMPLGAHGPAEPYEPAETSRLRYQDIDADRKWENRILDMDIARAQRHVDLAHGERLRNLMGEAERQRKRPVGFPYSPLDPFSASDWSNLMFGQ